MPVIVKRVPPKTEPEVGEIPVMVEEVLKVNAEGKASFPYLLWDVEVTSKV